MWISMAPVRGATIAAVMGALALAAPAGAATLDAGALLMLTGQSSLLAAFPEPVGPVTTLTPSAVSQDGRFVAFSSVSDGLSAEDDDSVFNVYVKDRQTGAVAYASRRDGAAGEPSHTGCFEASISDDGNRVAFRCLGALDSADTNASTDVYVRDIAASRTILVSRRSGLGTVGTDDSGKGVLSQDGRYVAFESSASLAAGTAGPQVYRREIGGADATIVVSRKTGPAGAAGGGNSPSISDDGNRIAFAADPGNPFYDAADTNNRSDVFVHDETADTTVLASRKDGATGAVDAQGSSTRPVISGNGAYVAFESTANQFDFANDSDTQPDIYRRALAPINTTQLVNISAGGTKGGPAQEPTIDDSGEAVAWVSTTTALDPADATTADPDVYFKAGNAIGLASRADGDAGAPAGDVDGAAVSGDGTKIVTRVGSPLTPDVDPRTTSLVMRDLAASPQRTTSVARPAGSAPFRNEGGDAFDLRLSADGRFAAFVTEASALGVPDDARSAVVVRDLVTDSVMVASREDGPAGAVFPGSVGDPAISADGRRVAFTVRTGFVTSLIYVRDLVTDRTFLASRADGADGAAADGLSLEPALDADGSRVAFHSTATNLGDGDADAQSDIHLRDLDTARTLLVSRATGDAGVKGNGASRSPDISADGSRITFISAANNLGDGDTSGDGDVHLRDVGTGTTTLVSAAPGGPKSDGSSQAADIDAAGTRVAFSTTSTNLLGLTTPISRIFVRDLSAGTLTLASRADGAAGAPADAGSFEPHISPDGGFVAFGSSSTNLAAGVEPDAYEIYRRDLAGGRTALASRGNPSTQIDVASTITNRGACVAFDAIATLVGPRVDGEQGYVRVFERNCGRPDPPAPPPLPAGGTPTGAARDRIAPVLSRARLSRTRFRVGPGRTPLTAKVGRGTVLRFSSSEAAKLTLRIERRVSGRRATVKRKRVCKPVRRRPKRGACTVLRRAGTLTRNIRAGAGSVALSGRLNRRALPRGTYRLTLTAVDASGNRSRAVRLAFQILP